MLSSDEYLPPIRHPTGREETSRRPGLFPRPGEVMDAIGIFRQFELPRLVGFRTEIVFREKMQLPVVHLIRVVERIPRRRKIFEMISVLGVSFRRPYQRTKGLPS